jgi:hypothetical protein
MVLLLLNTQVCEVVHEKTSRQKLCRDEYVWKAEEGDTFYSGKVTA